LNLTLDVQDAWGTTYRYELSADGQHYRLISAGKDRAFANPVLERASDDIVLSDGMIAVGSEARGVFGFGASRR
jgi:hypothetical protein